MNNTDLSAQSDKEVYCSTEMPSSSDEISHINLALLPMVSVLWLNFTKAVAVPQSGYIIAFNAT